MQHLVILDCHFYAGSHGFEISGPKGSTCCSRRGQEFLPALDQAEKSLRQRLENKIPGVQVERKKFAIAVHYRRAPEPSAGDRKSGRPGFGTKPRAAQSCRAKRFSSCSRISTGTRAKHCSGCWNSWTWTGPGSCLFIWAMTSPTKMPLRSCRTGVWVIAVQESAGSHGSPISPAESRGSGKVFDQPSLPVCQGNSP